MKRILNAILIISLAFSLASCALHSGLTSNMNSNVTNVVLQDNNYKIIQKVQGQASATYIFGIPVAGVVGGGFKPLIAKARNDMLRNVNLVGYSRAIINETVEVNDKFFLLFGIKTVTVSAYVIEFTSNNSIQQQSTQQIDTQPQHIQQESTQQINTQSQNIQLQKDPNAYLNFNEYQNGTPSLYFDFTLKEGGSTYKITEVIPKTDRKKIETEIWGIRVNGIDYINFYSYSGYPDFHKIEGKGYYSYFTPKSWSKEAYVILPTKKIQVLTPELLLELCKDNEAITKEIQAAKLKKNDIPKMFEILRQYNLAKK